MDDLYTELEKTKNEKEPALKYGSIVSALFGVLATINALFPSLLSSEVERRVTLVGVITLPLLVTWFVRKQVWSPATVNAIVEDISDARTTLEEIKNRQKDKVFDKTAVDKISQDFFGGDPYEAADSASKFDIKKEESYSPPKRPESLDDYGKPMPDIQHDPEDGP